MGGTVAVTVKYKNKITKMARKTGSYDFMLFSKEMREGNTEKSVNDYISIYEEMRKDFLSGEPYDMLMSPVYGSFSEAAPIDYGFIYIDVDAKKIHSCQEYDRPGAKLFSTIFLSSFESDKDLFNNYLEFFNPEIVKINDPFNKKEYSFKEFFGTDNSEEIQNMIKDHINKKSKTDSDIPFYNNNGFIELVLKDWEIIGYPETIEGYSDFYNYIKEQIELTKEDKEAWINYIEHLLEDYYDETIEMMEEEGQNEELIEDYINIKKVELLSAFKDQTAKIKLK